MCVSLGADYSADTPIIGHDPVNDKSLVGDNMVNTMTARLTGIIPQTTSISGRQASTAITKALQTFAFEAQRRVQKYPPQQPTHGSGQSLGKRAGARTRKGARTGPTGYRRTGTLGRNWLIAERTAFSILVVNGTKYAVYVEGPADGPGPGQRQARAMAERGWPSITAAAEEALKIASTKFNELTAVELRT